MNEKDLHDVIELRKTLHRLAELSGNENQTADYIHRYHQQFSPDSIVTGLGGNGLAVVFEGKKSGQSILLRCELDALPIPETVNFEYASKNPEVSHKCGHDGHMAILAGVAKHLSQNPLKRGRVILLFQPAEETGQGAKRVIEDPLFKNLEPDYAFALHNLPGYKKGKVLIKEGTFAAASVGMIVELHGATSHAGEPQNGRSPALALSKLIQDFSAVPQFYTSLGDAAKVTVIHAKLGEEAFGTSPGYCRFAATLRAYSKSTMAILIKQCTKHAKNTAKAYNLKVDVSFTEEFPEVYNDSGLTELVNDVATKKNYKVQRIEKPFSWSEDFGVFTQKYAGALFGIGSGAKHPSLHNPYYDFPDDILPVGVGIFTGIIDQIINNPIPG
ncbi:MAG: amidohydrolase [Candidatus Electryonea clarkiae]|nr:amidohydrolase [Candidatus Electryonea clarkiae]